MARCVISVSSGIWSLSGHSGLYGFTACKPQTVIRIQIIRIHLFDTDCCAEVRSSLSCERR